MNREWALQQIREGMARRDWSRLPSDYEAKAVGFVFARLKDHFCKRREIALRIRASKATTFRELEEILSQ